MELDTHDLEILKRMYSQGDPSPKSIAEDVDIPQSTVHYRLKNLRESGVLKNDLYEFDHTAVGLDVTIISEVIAEYAENYEERVGEALSEIEGVSEVFFTLGDTDFIVIAHLPDSDSVQDLVNAYESIDEVTRTSSRLVVDTVKADPNPIRNYSLDSLEEFDLSNGE